VDAGSLRDEVNDGLERLGLVGNNSDLVVLLLESLLGLGDDVVGSDLGVLVEEGLESLVGVEGGIRGEILLGGGRHIGIECERGCRWTCYDRRVGEEVHRTSGRQRLMSWGGREQGRGASAFRNPGRRQQRAGREREEAASSRLLRRSTAHQTRLGRFRHLCTLTLP